MKVVSLGPDQRSALPVNGREEKHDVWLTRVSATASGEPVLDGLLGMLAPVVIGNDTVKIGADHESK